PEMRRLWRWHATGHGAGVPVLEDAAGGQPQVELGVRRLVRRLVGQGEDVGLAVLVAVEAYAFTGRHVGVVALAEAPQGLLAVDHRPAQAAGAVIDVEVRQVMGMAAAELGVLLEDRKSTRLNSS